MNRLIKTFGVVGLLASPLMTLAQNEPVVPGGTNIGGPTVFNILAVVGGILNIVIPILITLAVIYVIAGVIKYVTASDNEKQAEGRTMIISGIVGLFVIVSIWGLVAVLNSTFGVNQGGTSVQNSSSCIIVGVDPLTGATQWNEPNCP